MSACPKLYDLANKHYENPIRVIQEWVALAGTLGFYTDDSNTFVMAFERGEKLWAAEFAMTDLDLELYRADIYMSLAGASQYGDRVVLNLTNGSGKRSATIMIGDQNLPMPEAL